MEIWKEISGTNGAYLVSNLGRVKSNKTGIILKPQPRRHGYLAVWLYDNGVSKRVSVHRLVAEAFCERMPGKNEVNHINENKQDNRAANLEWCTHSENCKAGTLPLRKGEAFTNGKRSKPICQYTMNGELVRTYPSIAEATRCGFPGGNVLHCIQGKYSHAYGYLWRYATEA